MDIVEKVIRAVAATYTRSPILEPEEARAALAAMLEAVGEPVAYLVASPTGKVRELHYNPNHLDADEQAAGWTETPLYSLAALREEGL